MAYKVLFAMVLMLVAVTPVGAGIAPPEPVSPGSRLQMDSVAERCPTFSWSGVRQASGYRLMVYELSSGDELGDAVIRHHLSAGASTWTPPLRQGLRYGAGYAWMVGAVSARGEVVWSEPALFRVASSPSQADFEAAMAVVQQYLEARTQAASRSPGAPDPPSDPVDATPRPSAESPKPLAPPPSTVLSVDGNVDASSFSGGGALLTGLDPANLSAGTAAIDISGTAATASDLVGVAVVSESELDFDPATQAELTAHSGTADAHREHATLEESAEIDSDIATHAGGANAHHAPTVVSGGSGVSVAAAAVELGSLTENWLQTGSFDIVLDNAASELRLLEATGDTYYGTVDVGNLNADRTYTFPNASGEVSLLGQDIQVGELGFDPVTETELGTHSALADAHREHATLEESAEIDSDIATHSGLPNVHHTPTVDTDTVLSEAQVEDYVTNGTLDMGNNPITNIGAAGTDFTAAGGLTIADDLRINGEGLGIGADRIPGTNANIHLYDGGIYSGPHINISGHNQASVLLERRRTDGGWYQMKTGCGSVNCPDDFVIQHDDSAVCVAIRNGCDVDIPSLEVGTFELDVTDTPGTCSGTTEARVYYDASLDEPCFCNGSEWRQFDGGGAC